MFDVYRRKGSSAWYYVVKVPGRPRLRRSAGTREEGKARKLARAVHEEEWKRRVDGDPATLTFARAAVIYTEDGGETTFLPPLIRHFRTREIATILPAEIQLAARKLYPAAKPATWNRQVIVPARAVINHCAELGLCHPIRVGRFAEAKPVRKAVTLDWLNKLRAHASPQLGALMTFMMMTAARLGQAIAVTPDHLDLADGTCVIPAAKRHAERTAFLPPRLVADLANLQPKRGPARDRVFGYLRKEPVYKELRAACTAAGIEYLGTHQPGRHTFATEMIVRQGVDVATTGDLGGWKSHRLLTETYAHAENQRAVANRVFGTLVTHPAPEAPPRRRKRQLKSGT